MICDADGVIAKKRNREERVVPPFNPILCICCCTGNKWTSGKYFSFEGFHRILREFQNPNDCHSPHVSTGTKVIKSELMNFEIKTRDFTVFLGRGIFLYDDNSLS